MFFSNSGEHVIIIKVTGEMSILRRNSKIRRWRRNLQRTKCAGPGRNGYRHCCGRRGLHRRISRCRNVGFLFEKRHHRRNIDIVSIVNFDDLRRRRKMFRNVQIGILSSSVGELGPVNLIGIFRESIKFIIISISVRGVT